MKGVFSSIWLRTCFIFPVFNKGNLSLLEIFLFTGTQANGGSESLIHQWELHMAGADFGRHGMGEVQPVAREALTKSFWEDMGGQHGTQQRPPFS